MSVLRDVIMCTLGNSTKPKDHFAKFVRTGSSARGWEKVRFVYLFGFLGIKKYTVSSHLSLFTVF